MNIGFLCIVAAAYIVGVIVALVVIAWLNSDKYEGEVMNEGYGVGSWFTIAFILLVAVGYYVTRPFNWLYERTKAFFER